MLVAAVVSSSSSDESFDDDICAAVTDICASITTYLQDTREGVNHLSSKYCSSSSKLFVRANPMLVATAVRSSSSDEC